MLFFYLAKAETEEKKEYMYVQEYDLLAQLRGARSQTPTVKSSDAEAKRKGFPGHRATMFTVPQCAADKRATTLPVESQTDMVESSEPQATNVLTSPKKHERSDQRVDL